jgi:hypothetical protein
MKVSELIEQLQDMNPDAEVHFAYNYGDHWRTEVAPTVDNVEEGNVKYSDYHRMPKVVEYDAEDDDNSYDSVEEFNKARAESQVVILR